MTTKYREVGLFFLLWTNQQPPLLCPCDLCHQSPDVVQERQYIGLCNLKSLKSSAICFIFSPKLHTHIFIKHAKHYIYALFSCRDIEVQSRVPPHDYLAFFHNYCEDFLML